MPKSLLMRSRQASLVVRFGAVFAAAAVLAGVAASTSPAAPPSCKHLSPPPPGAATFGRPRLTQLEAVCVLVKYPKVASWLRRYPKDLHGGATLYRGIWSVRIASGQAGLIAEGAVVDRSGKV